jgi:hypothetical protein
MHTNFNFIVEKVNGNILVEYVIAIIIEVKHVKSGNQFRDRDCPLRIFCE